MKLIVFFILAAGFNSLFCQVNDTLHIHIFGEFKKHEKFQLKFERQLVCNFGGNDKIIEAEIPVDTNALKAFDFLPMDVYKLNRFRNEYVLQFMDFLYYPGYNHILIYYLPFISKEFMVYNLPYFKHIHVLDNFNKM